jgi:hypothetical protein
MSANPNPFTLLLDSAEQAAMVRRLSNSGYSDESISIISGLSIELVRRILAERNSREESAP